MRPIDADFCKELGATCIATRNKNGDLVAITSLDLIPTMFENASSPDWTPVSEPPKEDGKYFVTLKLMEDLTYVDILSYSHNLYHIDRFDFADEKRPGWYDYDSEYGYYEINNVLAWMPLPETYKPESEVKDE